MNRAKARRDLLRKVPSIMEAQDEEWLGAEAHVRRQHRPFDWVHVFKTVGAGFTILSLGLAFLSGFVVGGTITSLIVRSEKD